MSAIASQFPLSSATSPRGGWITAMVASSRSGKSIGHLCRICRETWLAAGMARLAPEADGGKPIWWVREDADPSFARVKFPEHITFDPRSLSESQRAMLDGRKKTLGDWQVACAGALELGFTREQATAQYIARLQCNGHADISERTLNRWLSSYRSDGLAGLIDRRWLRGSTTAAPGDPFFEILKGYYLSTRQPSKRTCWELACLKAQEQGFAALGYRSACLLLETIPVAVVTKFRKGDDAFVAKCEPSIQRDYATLHTNEQWVGDHHQMDVIVAHEGKLVRPWLTCWLDMRSRKVVGWCLYAHDPNSNSILSALRGGILSHGCPEMVYIDNGKDYSSALLHGTTKTQRRQGKVQLPIGQITGILNHLHIKSRFCWAYHGQSKPIERWFGTLEDQFCRTWPTYCGSKTDNKPEDLQKRLARGEAPSLKDFNAVLADFIETIYHQAAHTGDGMNGASPAQVYDQSWNGFSKRTASQELLDLLLTRQTRPLRVHKNGVTFEGLSFGGMGRSPELFRWLGKEVYLRVDERDITHVTVWTPDDKFICIAQANSKLPANATHQELKVAILQKKQARKQVREYHGQRMRLSEGLPDLMLRARIAAQKAEAVNSTPSLEIENPTLKPVRSALEDQLPALRRAVETKTAQQSGTSAPSRFEYSRPQEAIESDEDDSAFDPISHWQSRAAGA